MITVQVSAKKIRSFNFNGYVTVNWLSPQHEGGFMRLFTLMVEDRGTYELEGLM